MFDPTAHFNWSRVSGFDTTNVLYTGPISGQGGSRWYLLLDSRARNAEQEARSVAAHPAWITGSRVSNLTQTNPQDYG